ncbi:MAG: hypothetical protein N2644_08020 [Candidatus Sumerlaea chitinivorans]|nr:hypothetical protein [Candidatus Sumerlaea chitinivorans]
MKSTFHLLLLIIGLCGVVPTFASGNEVSTETLLRDAIRATAQRNLTSATACYQQLCQREPETGYPLFARYLSRTRQTTAAESLRAELTRLPLSSLGKARTAVALGETTAAIEMLSRAPESDDLYARTILLYALLNEQGKRIKARRQLLRAIQAPSLTPYERRDLFRKLLADVAATDLGAVLLSVFADFVQHGGFDTPQLREMATDALSACDGQPGFAELRTTLSENATTNPLAAWFSALVAQRAGDVASAQSYLERAWAETSATRTGALIGEELAKFLVAQPDKAEAIYRQLITIGRNPDRVRLLFAQYLFKQKRYREVCALLESIDRSKLDETQRRLLSNMRLTAMATYAPAAEVVRAFEEEAAGRNWEQLRELAEAPFVLLPETPQHLEFRKALQARFRETTAPVELYVLMLSTEHQLRSQEAMLAALRAYVEARPHEYAAVDEYATAAGIRAIQLVSGPHETTPPLSQIQEAVDEAARALWKVVQNRPYALEPYQRLMSLYKTCQMPDKAREVPLALTKHTSATVEEIHLAAYLLAQEGFTTDSIPLYEEAIRKAPEIGRYKMNLAYAYQALGRNEEAMAIYRRLFVEGSFGRQHHIHQLVEDAYALAEKMGTLEDLLKFWNELRTKPDIPQRNEFLEHVARHLLSKKRYSEAQAFAETLLRDCPDDRDAAEILLAEIALAQGEISRARGIFMERASRAKSEQDRIRVRADYAALLASYQLVDQAVEEWLSVAREYSASPAAGRCYLYAAQAYLTSGKLTQARELVSTYLSRNYGDSDGERLARELMEKVNAQELGGDSRPTGK